MMAPCMYSPVHRSVSATPTCKNIGTKKFNLDEEKLSLPQHDIHRNQKGFKGKSVYLNPNAGAPY